MDRHRRPQQHRGAIAGRRSPACIRAFLGALVDCGGATGAAAAAGLHHVNCTPASLIRQGSMTIALASAPKASTRLFLDVERSALGRPWRDRLDERATARALTIMQRHVLPELLARILAGRDVEPDAVEAFLDPTVKRLMPDPHVLTAMEPAALRIADAVERAERVAIFGDYDVDGATASALLARFLRPLRSRPDRAYPGSHLRGLRAERRGDPLARRARRDAAGHRRLRHRQHRAARRGAPARPRRHRHRPPPGRRAPARRAGGQSQPARRSVRARPSRRRRPGVPRRRGGQPRAARARLLDARRGRSPICCLS